MILSDINTGNAPVWFLLAGLLTKWVQEMVSSIVKARRERYLDERDKDLDEAKVEEVKLTNQLLRDLRDGQIEQNGKLTLAMKMGDNHYERLAGGMASVCRNFDPVIPKVTELGK